MIREYIEQLYKDNEEELSKLDNQIKVYTNDLEEAQLWFEQLQRESDIQINIFSPRNIDDEIDEKIEKAKNKVLEIKRQIKCTREMRETHIKKRIEYALLLKEAVSERHAVLNTEVTGEIPKEYKTSYGFVNEADANDKKETDRNDDFAVSEIKQELTVKKAAETDQSIKNLKSEEVIKSAKELKSTEITEKTESTEATKELELSEAVELTRNLKLTGTIESAEQIENNKKSAVELHEFLSSLYRSSEICLALLNSDKNKCKNELQKMKKNIKEFAARIEM